MIHISSLSLPELEVYNLKNESPLLHMHEPDPGCFIAESTKVIRRALDAGYEPVSILTSIENPDADTKAIFEECKDVPIYLGDDSMLREISGYALTGGILCLMNRKVLPSLSEVTKDKKVIAVLEDVTNPTNVGAIFRSAAAMNVEAVILTHDCSDPLYRRAARVSMGNVFQLPWTMLDKDTDYISVLHEHGFSTVAMALSDDSVNISDPRIKESDRLAIILGNEGNGLSDDTIARSTFVAKIPMNPTVDSLNVAAASAVMFWELTRI